MSGNKQAVYDKLITPPTHLSATDYRWFVFGNFGAIIAALAHLFYGVWFALDGVIPLALFNIISVTLYVIVFWQSLYYPPLKPFFLTLIGLEVLAHAILTTWAFGWNSGFHYYILVLPLIIYFAPYGSASVRNTSIIAICLAYMLLFSLTRGSQPAYPLDEFSLNFFTYSNFAILFIFLTAFAYFYQSAATRMELALEQEHQRSEKLLLNILPASIAARLKNYPIALADRFPESTTLFSDIVGFTPLSESMEPEELVDLLNHIFSEFDDLAEKYRLEKIKTIGDAYMVAAGLPEYRCDHAEVMAEMALDMSQALQHLCARLNKKLNIRIGINSGPVVAGVIGKKKFAYDLWGDSVNTAARMESHGLSGEIQVTQTTYDLLKHKYVFAERGEIEVKGKGSMKVYLLKGRKV
jgi:class 3 adenylate cyclase